MSDRDSTTKIVRLIIFALCLFSARPLAAQSVACDPRIAVCPEWVPSSVVQQLLAERDDRPFHLAQGAFVVSAMTDLATTEYRLGQGGVREAWLGHGFEQHPVALGLLKGGLVAAMLAITQRIHREHPKTAWWMLVASAGVESYVAARNARIGGGR